MYITRIINTYVNICIYRYISYLLRYFSSCITELEFQYRAKISTQVHPFIRLFCQFQEDIIAVSSVNMSTRIDHFIILNV